MDGFLLVATKLSQITDLAGRDWRALETEYPLLQQDTGGAYIPKVLDFTTR
jgi:hypothetical protein